jgi:hypothetical protein
MMSQRASPYDHEDGRGDDDYQDDYKLFVGAEHLDLKRPPGRRTLPPQRQDSP